MYSRKIVILVSLWVVVFSYSNVFSQANNDYRTRQTGDWTTASTWERYNGSTWVTATTSPTATNAGVITIRNGHEVRVDDIISVDQVVVNTGGTISYARSGKQEFLNVVDGAGVDLINNGTINIIKADGTNSHVNVYGQMVNNGTISIQYDCHVNVYGEFENNNSVTTGKDATEIWYGMFNVHSGALLRCSPTSVIGGDGNFVLNTGATIEIASPQGISASGNTGNIQTANLRIFSESANYVYNGVENQITGTGLIKASELVISNTMGKVTLSHSVEMNSLHPKLGSKLDLNTYTHYSGVLIFPEGSYATETWGSSTSSAINKNNVYFDSLTIGVVMLRNRVVDTYTSSATFSTCVTDTAFKAVVETWGGGGRGAQASIAFLFFAVGGGGGGGGAYSRDTITINPGHVYTVEVGKGSTTTSPGGDSWFSSTASASNAVVLAKGGASVSNNTSAGANGGAANAGTGVVRYSGGKGANGVIAFGTNYAGGGGSSAGINAAGNSPSTGSGTPPPQSIGAVAPMGGGNGGSAKYGTAGPGNNGFSPGGGGGGGLITSKLLDFSVVYGGSGADGYVKVSYTPTFPAIYLSDTHFFVCQGTTTNYLHYNSVIGCPTLYAIEFGPEAKLAGFKDVPYTAFPNDSIPIVMSDTAPGGVYRGVLVIKNGDKGYPSSVIFTVEVNEVKFTTVGHDVSCYGSHDGSIVVNMSSANHSPYSFSIDNGLNYNALFTGTYPTFTMSNLSPATYKIRIKNKFGCVSKSCP